MLGAIRRTESTSLVVEMRAVELVGFDLAIQSTSIEIAPWAFATSGHLTK
jgi:hypothetical protein